MAIVDNAFREWIADFKAINPDVADARAVIDTAQYAFAAGRKAQREIDAARQPVGEPVCFIHPLDADRLRTKEFVLRQVGTYWSRISDAIPVYLGQPAQAVDLGQLKRFELFADEGPGLGGMSVDYEEADTGAWVRFDDVKALIDSQDSRNG